MRENAGLLQLEKQAKAFYLTSLHKRNKQENVCSIRLVDCDCKLDNKLFSRAKTNISKSHNMSTRLILFLV